MSPSVRYNAEAVEVRFCAQCDREWYLNTSMEQLVEQDGAGVFHQAGPFCPGIGDDRCALVYKLANPQWWTVPK